VKATRFPTDVRLWAWVALAVLAVSWCIPVISIKSGPYFSIARALWELVAAVHRHADSETQLFGSLFIEFASASVVVAIVFGWLLHCLVVIARTCMPPAGSTSHVRLLRWSSWVSLLVPFIAYVLCSEASTGHLILQVPPYGRNVGLLRHYAFLASTIIASSVLVADVGFKRRRLIWLPLASLILTYFLYNETLKFTRFIA
jgi:hypothetical protein